MDMPVQGDAPVVSDVVWQSGQPIEENKTAPFKVEDVEVAGVGGAERWANSAKFARGK